MGTPNTTYGWIPPKLVFDTMPTHTHTKSRMNFAPDLHHKEQKEDWPMLSTIFTPSFHYAYTQGWIGLKRYITRDASWVPQASITDYRYVA